MSVAGYCEQHDSLIDVLSVREMLEYTAELKCSQYLTHSTKIQRVDELLNEMGLTHIASSQVSVISGGERKRTSIALALVSKPPVLLLDEPTTGLDAATADDVLAERKKTRERRQQRSSMHDPRAVVPSFPVIDRRRRSFRWWKGRVGAPPGGVPRPPGYVCLPITRFTICRWRLVSRTLCCMPCATPRRRTLM